MNKEYWPFPPRVTGNAYHLVVCDDWGPVPLGPLLSVIDTKHRYKAPHANRPGDRPYERKAK